MVFLDFLDFLEFLETSEVAGPGPNPREIDISFGYPLGLSGGLVAVVVKLHLRSATRAAKSLARRWMLASIFVPTPVPPKIDNR